MRWAEPHPRLGTDGKKEEKQCLCFLAARRWASLPLHTPQPPLPSTLSYLRPKEMEVTDSQKLRYLWAEINLPTTKQFLTGLCNNIDTLMHTGVIWFREMEETQQMKSFLWLTSGKMFFTSSRSPWTTPLPLLKSNCVFTKCPSISRLNIWFLFTGGQISAASLLQTPNVLGQTFSFVSIDQTSIVFGCPPDSLSRLQERNRAKGIYLVSHDREHWRHWGILKNLTVGVLLFCFAFRQGFFAFQTDLELISSWG